MSAVRKSVFAIGSIPPLRSLCAEHLSYIEIRVVDDVGDGGRGDGRAGKGVHLGQVCADSAGTGLPGGQFSLCQLISGLLFCGPVRIGQRIESGKPPTLRSASLHGGYYDKRKIKRCVFPQLIMRDDLEYGPLLSVCVCLYRTSFLKEHDLRFDETVRYSEDNLFSACAGYRAASFFYLKGQGLYEYHRNPGSITTTHKADAWESYKRMHQKLCALFQNCPEYDFSRQLDLHIIHYACAALGGVCALPKVEQKSEIDRILNDEALKRALQNRPVRHIPVKLAIQLLCMQYRCTPLMCLWLQRREHYA